MAKKQIRVFLFMVVLVIVILFPMTVHGMDELKNTDPDRFYVLLDLKNQFVTVFERDADGAYTKVVRRFICTSGRTEVNPNDPEDQGTPTPTGIWKMGGRERFGKFAAFGGEYARYWTQIVGGNFFHSIMFSRRDINYLKSGAYHSLGNPISHGCVRLYVEDAKWLYYYACPGTKVEVSDREPRNNELKRALKSKMPFGDYNEFQKTIYDQPEQPNPRAWIVYEGAPLRTGNGSNDGVIKKLSKDVEVEVLQVGDPWVKVLVDEREGYVKLAYVTFEQGVMHSKEDADILKVTARLYEEPSKDAKQIVKVPYDSSIKVLETNEGGWTKIEYLGEVGWVISSNLVKGWGTIRD